MWRQVVVVVLVAGVAWLAEFADQAPAQPIPEGWQVDVLRAIGNDAPSADAIAFLSAWHRAEGGTARFNWLNSTQGMEGDSMYNSVGVRNYPSYEAGVVATAATLTNGFYPRTLAGLQTNNPIIDDAELGLWGTGGEAVRRQLEETQKEQNTPRVSSKCLPTSTGAISAHFSDTSSGYWAAQFGGMHNGTDFSGTQGDPVYAPFDLTVEDIQYYGDAARIGWYVQGRFQDGYLFYAGHLGAVSVRVGDRVGACQQIGTIGEVFHTHIKVADPSMPVPCEATGCVNFERYFEEH